MPVIRFTPDSYTREGTASAKLSLQNVVAERTTLGTGNPFEQRARAGQVLIEGDGEPGSQYVRGLIALRDIGGEGHLALLDETSLLTASTQGGPKVVYGNLDAFFLNKGGITAYTVDDTEPLGYRTECIDNTETNQFVSDDIAYLNLRLLAVERGSGRVWFTEIRKEKPSLLDDPAADDVFPGLNYFDAQESGDQTIGLEAVGEQVIVMGRATIQIFNNQPSADRPFAAQPGSTFDYGLLGTGAKCRVAGTFAFVSEWTDKNPNRRVYIWAGAEVSPLSNDSVEGDLQDLTPQEAASLQLFSYGDGPHQFIVVQAHGKWTWVYDVRFKNWSRYVTAGRPDYDISAAAMGDAGAILGSTAGPNVARLNTAADDYQGTQENAVTFALQPSGRRDDFDRMGLDMAVPEDPVTLYLDLSYDDGDTFSVVQAVDIPAGLNVAGQPIFQGLGSIPPQGAVARLRWSGHEPRAIAAALLNESCRGG